MILQRKYTGKVFGIKLQYLRQNEQLPNEALLAEGPRAYVNNSNDTSFLKITLYHLLLYITLHEYIVFLKLVRILHPAA